MGTRLTFVGVRPGGCLTTFRSTPAGIHPRAAPGDYAVSRPARIVTDAASLLPAHQVKRLFAVDISTTYLVFRSCLLPP
jgi:hypothetical protein